MAVEQGAWPDRSQYAHLVQVPHNFADEELRGASLTLSRRGGPRVWSGARAMVFQAQTADRRLLAVRVFLNAGAADPTRYAALSQHLEQRSVPAFVWTRWVDEGLVYDTNRVPLIKMQWVDGIPLDEYLVTCLAMDRPSPALAYMAEEWRRESQNLTSSDLAHGDIHAQNVLVCPGAAPGQIRYQLVDYDGVWVPSLHSAPREVGHAAYQHPRHVPSYWGPSVDAFPATLVYLSLRALAAEPALWDRFHTDDTLLFRHEDLTDARSASVWAALAASPESLVRSLTAVVIRWLDDQPDAMGSLEEAVAAASVAHALPPRAEAAGTDQPNVWPPKTGPTLSAGGRQPWGAPLPANPVSGIRGTTVPGPAMSQQWPGAHAGHGAGGRPAPSDGANSRWLWVLAIVVVVVIIALLAI
jgi:eukaryotic-like serine/threonine-protein kinase